MAPFLAVLEVSEPMFSPIPTPTTAASAGMIGMMYAASLESDTEKNTNVNAEQISRNRRGLKDVVGSIWSLGNRFRHAARHARTSEGIQSDTATNRSGMKYHQGSYR